jgi:carbon monoxide dehydrogenase subunit G
MASIRKEITVALRPDAVWDRIADIGALHTRLVPGFVVDTRLEPGARIVTFGNGIVAREAIVDQDDAARRLVWTIQQGRMTHHNGAIQVFPAEQGGSRIVWVADILPHELKDVVSGMMDQGMAAMKATLDAGA